MEICWAILFTALFPLVAHTSWDLSDCVVDGKFRIKFNGLRLREVYPGCGYEEGYLENISNPNSDGMRSDYEAEEVEEVEREKAASGPALDKVYHCGTGKREL